MKYGKHFNVKWSNAPTSFDQAGCDGVCVHGYPQRKYIQEMTVKAKYIPRIVWDRAKDIELSITVTLLRKYKKKFKLPRFIKFAIAMRHFKHEDYIMGG